LAKRTLDYDGKNKLLQSRGEVENIPPGCLPGEGAFEVAFEVEFKFTI
jgi:hypothetical protein